MDATKPNSENPITQAKNFITDMAQSAQESGSAAVSELSKKVQDNAQLVKDKAEAAVEDLKSGSNDALNTVGEKISEVSASIADTAKDHPTMAPAIKSVAGGLDSTGNYLQNHSVGEVGEDLVNVIRQHPLQSMALAVGLGILISQAFSRR